MATVSSTIKMMDQFSRPFQRVTNQIVEATVRMERLKRVMESPIELEFEAGSLRELEKATQYAEKFETKLRSTASAAQRVVLPLEHVEQNQRVISGVQERINHQLQSAHQYSQSWSNKLQGVASAYYLIQGVLQSIVGVMETMDIYINTQARLDLINDKLQTTAELQDKIFASAERARGSYTDMAGIIGKMGTMAEDAFKSNDELIAFTELMQKSFRIGGSSTSEQQAGMYQLAQAMAAGKLQGDEFRSIMENAPMLAQAIADATGKSKGELKKMSAEGTITADVIKAAMFNAADDINQKFETMPRTFGDIMNELKNTALQSFGPVIERINEMLNTPGGAQFIADLQNQIVTLAVAADNLLTGIVNIYNFFSSNWGMIEPLIIGIAVAFGVWKATVGLLNFVMGIQNTLSMISLARTELLTGSTLLQAAATKTAEGAQIGLNAALLASPITWIILGIIALIALFYIVVGAINKFAGTSLSATGMIAGAFATVGAVIGNIFIGLLKIVFGVVQFFNDIWTSFANFFGNLFNDPVAAVINLFADMADAILGVLEKIASAMDTIFGSNMAGAVSDWRGGLSELAQNAVKTYGNGTYADKAESFDIDSIVDDLGRFNYGASYKAGYDWGANLFGGDDGSSAANAAAKSAYDSYTKVPAGAVTTASTSPDVDKVNEVGKINDTVDISSEDLKLLRELAEMKNIQNFVSLTPTVQVTTGPVNNGADIDTIVARIEEKLTEEIASSAQGVYS